MAPLYASGNAFGLPGLQTDGCMPLGSADLPSYKKISAKTEQADRLKVG